MSLKNKEKIKNIIFLRACCCMGIVIYHYFCHSKVDLRFLYATSNGDFAFMFVTCFFCISGFVLYYNYPKTISIKKFYYKRWKSILIPYYISFIYFFFIESLRRKKLLYNRNRKMFIFNILGLDGYLNYRFKTFYLVGEWFLGAIIIIYIMFPIILIIINKSNIIINNILFCSLYFLMYKKRNYFIIIPQRNIITCIFSFYFGMESFKYKHFFFI